MIMLINDGIEVVGIETINNQSYYRIKATDGFKYEFFAIKNTNQPVIEPGTIGGLISTDADIHPRVFIWVDANSMIDSGCKINSYGEEIEAFLILNNTTIDRTSITLGSKTGLYLKNSILRKDSLKFYSTYEEEEECRIRFETYFESTKFKFFSKQAVFGIINSKIVSTHGSLNSCNQTNAIMDSSNELVRKYINSHLIETYNMNYSFMKEIICNSVIIGGYIGGDINGRVGIYNSKIIGCDINNSLIHNLNIRVRCIGSIDSSLIAIKDEDNKRLTSDYFTLARSFVHVNRINNIHKIVNIVKSSIQGNDLNLNNNNNNAEKELVLNSFLFNNPNKDIVSIENPINYIMNNKIYSSFNNGDDIEVYGFYERPHNMCMLRSEPFSGEDTIFGKAIKESHSIIAKVNNSI